MKISKRSIFSVVTSLISFAFFLFLIISNGATIGVANSSETSQSFQSGASSLDLSEASENSFEYYRDILFDKMNFTLESYELLPEDQKKVVNNYVYALWGFENGTYTMEQAQEMIKPNSPSTAFKYGDLYISWAPTSDSTYRTDGYFRVDYKSTCGWGERIRKIKTYLDSDDTIVPSSSFNPNSPTVMQLQMQELHNDPNTGYISGQYWQAASWYDVFNNYHYGICYHWPGISDNSEFRAYGKPGYIDNRVKIIISYEYEFWDIWKDWPLGGWQPIAYYNDQFNYELNFIIFPVGLTDDLNIWDDDVLKPDLDEESLFTFTYDKNGEIIYDPPVINDSALVFGIGGDAFDESYIGDITVEIGGKTFSYDFTTQHWAIYNDRFYIYIYYPGYYLGLGQHTASITLTDGDDDRNNDELSAPPFEVEFEIVDDDTDPPIITEFDYSKQILDSDPCQKVKFKAYDYSGILEIVAHLPNALDPNNFQLYETYIENDYICVDLPNPRTPNTYFQALAIFDADLDRENDVEGKLEPLLFSVVDDDMNAPSVQYLNTWKIFDSEDYLELKISATDNSGIGEVYVNFAGIKYQGSYNPVDELYYVIIPNPRTPDTYNLDIWVWDDDNDGWTGDNSAFHDTTQSFTVVDDDFNEPSVQYLNTWEIFDSEDYLELKILAKDDSGIGEVYVNFAGIKYQGSYNPVDELYYVIIPNPRIPDTYNLDIWVWDDDYDYWTGDTLAFHDTTQSFTVEDDDITCPTVNYVNDWSIFDSDDHLEIKILALEDYSGIGEVYVNFDGIKYMGNYESSDGCYHVIIPNPRTPGTYNLDIWVWNDDYDGWAGDEEAFHDTTQSFTIEDDDINFPEFDLIKSPMGDSGANVILPFQIEAFDESGINLIQVEIAGQYFTGSELHYLILPPGTYTMYVWVTDDDNDRIGDSLTSYKEFTIHLLKLDVNEWLTDSDFNPVANFDFIFRKEKPSGYSLVATNPGQFYYHIEVTNTWPTKIDILTIEAILPSEFILKGSVPIHVYLDGIDITGLSEIIENTIIINNIEPGSKIYITIHMDFALKGEYFASLDDFILKSYRFSALATGECELYGTFGSFSSLIGHQKKTTGICGFVTDGNGTPKADIEVFLYLGDEYINTAITDENGFYYFLDVEDNTNYNVRIYFNGTLIMAVDVVTVKDEFIEVNLACEDI